MVGSAARAPRNLLHSAPPDQDILKRLVKGMPHMQPSGGGIMSPGIRLCRVRLGVKISAILPEPVRFVLDLLGV